MANKELTDDEIQALKQEHGDELVSITHPSGLLVFKKPSKPIWQRFFTAINDSRKPDGPPTEQLCVACCVIPTPEELSQTFIDYPALPDVIAIQLTRLAKGIDGDADVVKL